MSASKPAVSDRAANRALRTTAVLAADEPQAVEWLNPKGTGPFVFGCEHASNRIPTRLGTMGLDATELARHIGDQEMRNELFICGVFSLLDRLFQQPLAELLRTVPVPQRVHETLIDGTGPYAPYFRLVQAIEAESLYDFRECAEALMMDVREINRAELRALASAADLD